MFARPYGLWSVSQEVGDPLTQEWVESQDLQGHSGCTVVNGGTQSNALMFYENTEKRKHFNFFDRFYGMWNNLFIIMLN